MEVLPVSGRKRLVKRYGGGDRDKRDEREESVSTKESEDAFYDAESQLEEGDEDGEGEVESVWREDKDGVKEEVVVVKEEEVVVVKEEEVVVKEEEAVLKHEDEEVGWEQNEEEEVRVKRTFGRLVKKKTVETSKHEREITLEDDLEDEEWDEVVVNPGGEEQEKGLVDGGKNISRGTSASVKRDSIASTSSKSIEPRRTTKESVKSTVASDCTRRAEPVVLSTSSSTDEDDDIPAAGQARSEEESPESMVCAKIFARLYDHQRAGVHWMWKLHTSARSGFGGILADDMGMGKTFQTSVFLAAVLAQGARVRKRKAAMVVAPKTLLAHWRKELIRCGLSDADVMEFEGTKIARQRSLDTVLRNGGVLLVTYGMIQHNAEQLSLSSGSGAGNTSVYEETQEREIEGLMLAKSKRSRWAWMVLDEGHKLKNHKMQLAQHIRSIPVERRLILTGTPVQNNLKELWSLYDFCCPGLLGHEHDFKTSFERLISLGADKDASQRERQIASNAGEKLRSILAPYFLRREKSCLDSNIAETSEGKCTSSVQVKSGDLPQKNDIVVWLKLSVRQKALYESFLSSKSVRGALNKTGSVLAAVNVMKKICNSPELLSEEALLETQREECGGHACFNAVDSSKVTFVLQLISHLNSNGHRALIFSQSRVLLDIVGRQLDEEAIAFLRIDGSVTSSQERQDRVDRFNCDISIPVCLLTTQVGGLGLTLTGADRVIIMDPSWNPSADNQAVDRAYRIGQSRDVVVYRLITCGTVEEKVYRTQVFKNTLMRASTQEEEQFRYFNSSERRDLFSTTEQGMEISTTQRQLAQVHTGQRQMTADLEMELPHVERAVGVAGISDHDLLFTVKSQVESGPGAARGLQKEGYFGSSSSSSTKASRAKESGKRYGSTSSRTAGPVWRSNGDINGGSSLLDTAVAALTPKRAAKASEGARRLQQELQISNQMEMLSVEIESKKQLLSNDELRMRLPDKGARLQPAIANLEKQRAALVALQSEHQKKTSDASSKETENVSPEERDLTNVFNKMKV